VDGQGRDIRRAAERQLLERQTGQWMLSLSMIAKERFPALQRPALPRHHVDQNRGLRDIDAQFEQFAVDPESTPQRVLLTQSLDQISHLLANPWPATRFPSPVCGKAHSMPPHNRLCLTMLWHQECEESADTAK